MTTEYDASKYMADPRFPDLQCPVCDFQCDTLEHFENHLMMNHSMTEKINAMYVLLSVNWKMELLIRRLTGKQAYEAIEAEGDL